MLYCRWRLRVRLPPSAFGIPLGRNKAGTVQPLAALAEESPPTQSVRRTACILSILKYNHTIMVNEISMQRFWKMSLCYQPSLLNYYYSGCCWCMQGAQREMELENQLRFGADVYGESMKFAGSITTWASNYFMLGVQQTLRWQKHAVQRQVLVCIQYRQAWSRMSMVSSSQCCRNSTVCLNG